MAILVTGGAGFIGSHLACALEADGEHVRVLDDLSTGDPGNLPSSIPLHRGDVREHADVAAVLGGVTQVYHLAAAVGPALVAADPRGTWSRNVRGTRVVLRACARRRIPVLLASSSEVYQPSAAARGPLTESAPTGAPRRDRRGVYARSKLAGEALGARLARRGLAVTCARFFNVVGPWQSPRHGMVLARFCEAARRGMPLRVYGDGMQQRCFLHVDDAVRALRALAAERRAVGRAVNIGNVEETTILDLARRVARAAGGPERIEHVPLVDVYGPRFRDPRVRRPETTLLRSLTGWQPRFALDDIIEDVLASDVMLRDVTRRRDRLRHPRPVRAAAP